MPSLSLKNNSFLPKQNAFTLLELITVIIIVASMAAFAIPRFTKTIERSHEQDAIVQLRALHAANKIYFARQEKYWPPVGWGGGTALANINAELGLNIIANEMTYACTITASDTTFTCTATRVGGAGFVVTVTEANQSATNPQCTSSCP